MAQAASKDAWSRTSATLAMLANVNRDPKKHKQPFMPRDFDPWTAPPARPQAQALANTMKRVSTRVLTRILLETPQGKESFT
jgi:hypothetical protein